MEAVVVLLRRNVALVMYRILHRHSAGLECKGSRHRGIKPSALRPATVEASMNSALSDACEVAFDHAAPRCAPLRSAPSSRYAVRVWSMQASGLAGRMSY